MTLAQIDKRLHAAWLKALTAGRTAGHRAASLAKASLHRGTNLLVPPVCANCLVDLADIESQPFLCQPCRRAFLVADRTTCPRCGLVLAEGTLCAACRKQRFRFDCLTALGDYRGELREAVLRMKRPSGAALAASIAALLGETRASQLCQWNVDVVTFIPMHWGRRLVRGINSPERMAVGLGRLLELPVARMLRRRRYTPTQGFRSRQAREANVKGAFTSARTSRCRAARVMLVDDVVTSGATCNEAARVLKNAGAQFVGVVAVCRTQGQVPSVSLRQ
jgi:ComF family protein